jgi:tetratricopeptide (TPR) repeat protein
MQNSPFSSAHQDVLQAAIPTDDQAALDRLVDECKNRARAAVQAQAWPDAAALYRKALDCCSTSDDKDTAAAAVLHANLSLVQGKMNQWGSALTAADSAVREDPSYTKGWWRLGQAKAALKDFDGALAALLEATKLEPTNKALAKELSKMKKEAEICAAAPPEALASFSEGTTNTASTPVTTNKTSKTVSVKETKATTAPVDEGTFSKSDHVKGYKIVNGKKTSYFHNELSEDAARLIGDIAPKKLDSVADRMEEDEGAPTTGGTSVWNKAGTWEERDVSAWAVQELKALLDRATYRLPDSSPAPDAVVSVESSNVTGHASVATVRGKTRYIYELSVTINWEFSHGTDKASGNMQFPDVDGTCAVGEPYDATGFTVSHADDSNMRPLLESFVYKQGLRDVLHARIDEWVQMFREKY